MTFLAVAYGLFIVVNSARIDAAEILLPSEQWQIVMLKGERIGFGYARREAFAENGIPRERTETLAQFRFKRGGKPFLLKTVMRTVESPTGDFQSVEWETANPPAQTVKVSAKLNSSGTELEVSTTINGQVQAKKIPSKAGLKSPAWQDRATEVQPLKPGEVRAFETFLPELQQITSVTLTARDWEIPAVAANPAREKWLKVEILNSFAPNAPFTCWMNTAGSVPLLTMPLLGDQATVLKVTQAEALKQVESGDLDLNVASSVPVANPPLKPHQQQWLAYRVTTRQGDLSKIFPVSPSQKVEKVAEQTALIEVKAIPFPENRSTRSPGAEFQDPSAYIQSEDRRVQQHAITAVGEEKHPSRRAKLMEAYVYRQVKLKNFSTALASAAEVAQSLEGDCTESAVLLAAMLRAKGIPSRIAVGLVYVENQKAFGCHMWTEAWLGDQWIGLDATIGQGGLGAGHLKMLDSSFADSGPTPIATFVPLLTVLGQLSIQTENAK